MTFPHIEFAAKSDSGRKRANNEDAFGVFPEAGIFCVADGMGGGDDGEIASAAVVGAVEAFATAHKPPPGAGYSAEDLADGLSAALNGASAWIFDRSRERQLKGCGSTFVGFCLDATSPESAVAMHAGDSRLYRIRGKSIKQMTKDHSAAEMIGAKDESAINPMFRGMILRAVGLRPHVNVERTPLPLKEGDRIVLCSDGLSRMLEDPDIADIVHAGKTPADAAEALVAAANDAGGQDNVTAVVVFVGKMPLALPAAAFPAAAASGEDAASDGASASTAGTCDDSGTAEGFGAETDTDERVADEPATEDNPPPAPPAGSAVRDPGSPFGRILSRRRARRIRSLLCKALAAVSTLVLVACLCVHLARQRKAAAAAMEAERIKGVQSLAGMSGAAMDADGEGRASADLRRPPEPEVRAAPAAAAAGAAPDESVAWPADVLPRLVAALSPSNATAFVKTARRFPNRGEVESLAMRFRPMCDASLPADRRRGLAAGITADVQDVAKSLRTYAKSRLAQIDAALAEHTTRAEFKETLLAERGGLSVFMERTEEFVGADPGSAGAQARCAEIVVGVPEWFRLVK